MAGYVISIVVATVVSVIVAIITPDKWEKYVGIVTGMVITLCIGQPVISLVDNDIFKEMNYGISTRNVEGEKILSDELSKELQIRVEEDAKVRLKNEFGAECDVEAAIKRNKEGQIEGVSEIHISGDKIDAVAIGRLRQIYGATEVKYIGN